MITAGDVVGGPVGPREGGGVWSTGRGVTLDRGGDAQGAVGGVAPYPEGEPAALGGGGGGGMGATELVGTSAGSAEAEGLGPAGRPAAGSVGGNGVEVGAGDSPNSVLSSAGGRSSAGQTDEAGDSSSGDSLIGFRSMCER